MNCLTAFQTLPWPTRSPYLSAIEHVWDTMTYATDKYVPDSASTATAFLCGVKTKYEGVGVDDSILHADCSSVPGTEVRCIGEWAIAEVIMNDYLFKSRASQTKDKQGNKSNYKDFYIELRFTAVETEDSNTIHSV
ncbi:alkaline phosphatase, tissue-nonspecific isozyme [Trichonephila clavipes]|nr:alkaline phosphatase, tissue-nonspecific isozyme [Trichonephila clavipes]